MGKFKNESKSLFSSEIDRNMNVRNKHDEEKNLTSKSRQFIDFSPNLETDAESKVSLIGPNIWWLLNTELSSSEVQPPY